MTTGPKWSSQVSPWTSFGLRVLKISIKSQLEQLESQYEQSTFQMDMDLKDSSWFTS